MGLIRPKGMLPGVLTAFTEDYQLDENRYRDHIKWLIDEAKVHGLSITAVNGEFYALHLEEFKRCQEIAVEVGGGKVQLWSNFGAESFEKTLEMGQIARDAGMDGLRIIHPYFVRYSSDGLYNYYKDLAKALPDMAIMIYPQTFMTGRPFPIDVLIKLADIDNIVSAKISTTLSFNDVCTLHAFTKDKDFDIIPGSLTMFYHMCRAGIQTKATIGPEPQWAPKVCQKIWEACMNKNWDDALNGIKELIDINNAINPSKTPENQPAQPKTVMKLLGRPLGPARRPCVMPDPEEEEEIKNALIATGLLKVHK